MTPRVFVLVSSSLFALIAVVHALRLVYAWPVTLAEWAVPVWLSWVGLIIAGYLSYQGFVLRNKTP